MSPSGTELYQDTEFNWDWILRVLVLAISKRNTNAAEVILFLHRLVQVLVEYFKELEEESIRDNFVIIYELLDEMMDFGFPQTTESKILQEYTAFRLDSC